jgi:hypothetical protein
MNRLAYMDDVIDVKLNITLLITMSNKYFVES